MLDWLARRAALLDVHRRAPATGVAGAPLAGVGR
jgi:hypothetical protein